MIGMRSLDSLKKDVFRPLTGAKNAVALWKCEGYASDFDAENVAARANAAAAVFRRSGKYVYRDDLIPGSLRGAFVPESEVSDAAFRRAKSVCDSFGETGFWTNRDHYAPSWRRLLSGGVGGILADIEKSEREHSGDGGRMIFLESCRVVMTAFSNFIAGYARSAESLFAKTGEEELKTASEVCRKVTVGAPESFREALQLVWLLYIAFQYEERYAMAFGRLDQVLRPFYEKDISCGALTREYAVELVASAFVKIGEHRTLFGCDDVSNIAVGGVLRDGSGGVNELSYVILEAVRRCNIPGPNLSARIYGGVPDEFLDECLKVVGTGLGYPAFMNDEVNIPALLRHGYSEEDCRDYCMVGCIENFIQGRQPPWSDGRYNTPKYIELALNSGVCMLTGVSLGPKTVPAGEMRSMDDFLNALKIQMKFGAAEYAARFRNENERYALSGYAQPFLSCFCEDCIGRGLDIRNGGALYPSVHGVGAMGIATFADSLAAIENVVFERRITDMPGLRNALANNFAGAEELRAELLAAPKYGNDDERADKYAVLYVSLHEELFSKYRTYDGGAFYIAIASNVNNIPAGLEVAATPDGRRAGEPLSDAASPMRGMDRNGPTAALLSVSKPDYRLVSCGTVLNQKYSPEMFSSEENRARLRAMIKAYFMRGGQEIQINSVSREILAKAIEEPDNWRNLVVRVSGFSAFYTTLDRAVQEDILLRTEHKP